MHFLCSVSLRCVFFSFIERWNKVGSCFHRTIGVQTSSPPRMIRHLQQEGAGGAAGAWGGGGGAAGAGEEGGGPQGAPLGRSPAPFIYLFKMWNKLKFFCRCRCRFQPPPHRHVVKIGQWQCLNFELWCDALREAFEVPNVDLLCFFFRRGVGGLLEIRKWRQTQVKSKVYWTIWPCKTLMRSVPSF